MYPRPMHAVIDGVEYSTEGSALLARTANWDGYSWECPGPDEFLYRTLHGEYFLVRQEGHHAEQDTLVPLNHKTAQLLYRRFPVHQWDEEHALKALWGEEQSHSSS